MRLLIDSMIVVMVLSIIGGTVAYRQESTRQDLDLDTVCDGLDRFQTKLQFHSALWQAQEQAVGEYPPQVMPGWFDDRPPQNTLISTDRPWVDIAPLEDYNDQPPDPLATGPGQASFWYNPALGVVRARVPVQNTDRQTLELYNMVNGTSLSVLPCDRDPDRAPLAWNANRVTTGQHASPDGRTVGRVQAFDLLLESPVDEEAQDAQQQEEIPWWDTPRLKARSEAQEQAQAVVEVDTDDAPARRSLLSP
jgi:hypothetical protein